MIPRGISIGEREPNSNQEEATGDNTWLMIIYWDDDVRTGIYTFTDDRRLVDHWIVLRVWPLLLNTETIHPGPIQHQTVVEPSSSSSWTELSCCESTMSERRFSQPGVVWWLNLLDWAWCECWSRAICCVGFESSFLKADRTETWSDGDKLGNIHIHNNT